MRTPGLTLGSDQRRELGGTAMRRHMHLRERWENERWGNKHIEGKVWDCLSEWNDRLYISATHEAIVW